MFFAALKFHLTNCHSSGFMKGNSGGGECMYMGGDTIFVIPIFLSRYGCYLPACFYYPSCLTIQGVSNFLENLWLNITFHAN